MAGHAAFGTLRVAGFLIFVTSLRPAFLQALHDSDSSSTVNCTTDSFSNIHPTLPTDINQSKTIYRNFKDNQNRPDKQELARRFDERLDDRHLDYSNYNKELDSRQFSNSDDQLPNAYINNHRQYEAEDYDSNRRLSDQNLNRNANEERTIDDQLKQNFQKSYGDPYLTKKYENVYSTRFVDDRNYDGAASINHQRIHEDQPPNKRIQEYDRSRFQDSEHSEQFNDGQKFGDARDRNFKVQATFDSTYPTNRYVEDVYLPKRFDSINYDRSVDDPNYGRHVIQKDPDGFSHREREGDYFSKQSIKEPIKLMNDSTFETRLSESNADNDRDFTNRRKEHDYLSKQSINEPIRHVSNSDLERRLSVSEINNQRDFTNRRKEDNYFSKQSTNEPASHVNKSTFGKGLSEPKIVNHRDDKQPVKFLGGPHLERHIMDNSDDDELQPVKPLEEDIVQSVKPLDESNFDRHYKQSSEKHLDDLHPDRELDASNFDRRLVEPTPDQNRRIVDQNYDKDLVDHSPGKQEGNNVHPDRRLGEQNYDLRNNYQRPDWHNQNQRPNVAFIDTDADRRFIDRKIFNGETTITPRMESNMSHLMTFTLPKDWEENIRPKLIFPNKTANERYKMATLHLEKGLFVFNFLRSFLSIIQPRNIPLDLLKDALEGRVNVSTLISQSLRIEIAFIAVISVFAVLMFVVPGIECWLCCRPHKYNYRRTQHSLTIFFLTIFLIVIGACMVTMLICNEEVSAGIDRIPETTEAALQDLRDYHSGTVAQLRRCLTRSLDVASEAILADLDSVEELLGKPVQAQLSSETGVDVALEALMDVANASQELAYVTDGLLKRAERAREFGSELSHEADELRRDLERTARDCAPEDRSLCAVLDPSGLHLALRLERVARDDRLLRLRAAGRDNLTEAGRQARGEYLYVPHHVARTTLEARNLIRREINTARAKVSDEARSIEASGSDLSNQLDTVRRLTNQIVPYVQTFEYTRWYVGFGTSMCVLFVWLFLFGALCCRCGSSEKRVRPTLLCCLVSVGLWLVVIAALAIASHAEMLLCRPLDDPEFRTVETILETKSFLGRRLSVPLKDLFEKCEENDAAYQAFQLDNTLKLEQLTAHWTWTGLTRGFGKLRVELTGLRILSPNLRERLQNLLYACGSNLTEHRVMIQGPILNKDLNALSDQVENVARQLSDRRTARSFQTLAAQMRDLLSRRVKPLMKMQDELVYQLAGLDLHLQPLQRQVNQTLMQLRNVQYYIDNQGDKIGLLKTKAYVDRLGSYLDQWRAHVLTEMSSGVAKCRPLWDILQGIKLLLCSHILGPLNGFWFATFICAFTLLVCTPTAHNLASSYWRPAQSRKGSILLSRQGSPDTVVVERETWRSPNPPPSMDSW